MWIKWQDRALIAVHSQNSVKTWTKNVRKGNNYKTTPINQ